MRSVSSRTRTPQPFSATATGLIAPAPFAVAIVSSSPWISTGPTPSTPATAAPGNVEVALDAGDDHVGADRALELLGRALGDDAARRR